MEAEGLAWIQLQSPRQLTLVAWTTVLMKEVKRDVGIWDKIMFEKREFDETVCMWQGKQKS